MIRTIQKIKLLAGNKSKIVLVYGIFNIIHPGHLRMLRFAKECGDFLIVAVTSDKLTPDATFNEKLRLNAVQSLVSVDFTLIIQDSPSDFVSMLKPDFLIKGKEHENLFNEELKIMESFGGKLLFSSGDNTFSSIDLLRGETENINYTNIIIPKDYIKSHKLTLSNLSNTIENFKKLNICVIGDTILDEYIQCDPLGMSQEDPTIVVTPIHSNKFIGGAAIVASHASKLGCNNIFYFSVTGKDENSNFVKNKLDEYGVTSELFFDESRSTTLKQRFRAGNKTLLRVSHLRQHKISKDLQKIIFDKFMNIIDKLDLLIFADFNYGLLAQELVDKIILECNLRNITIVADSQSSSQIGDVSRFRNTKLLTPTERELRGALGNYEDSLVVAVDKLIKKTNTENVIVTLGAEGLLICNSLNQNNTNFVDRLPALNSNPTDIAGAGDCLLVCTAMSLVLKRSIWESVYIGSIGAACQVGRTGNIPLTYNELMSEVKKQFI